jgi:hypothetical protein
MRKRKYKVMTKNKNQKRLGLFYVSNGKWVGPYMGTTFTKFSAERNPMKSNIRNLANYVLKSRVKVLPVG